MVRENICVWSMIFNQMNQQAIVQHYQTDDITKAN